jgi:hypothetical protein
MWKNISSFSRSEINREPKTWFLDLGKFSITVTRHKDYEPDVWLMRTELTSDYVLDSKNIEAAKIEAISIVSEKLNDVQMKLERVLVGDSHQ